jgi:DivIVA domain-containing protein
MLSGSEHGFDQAMRGYDRDQVDRYMLKADDDLRVAVGQRDAALSRSADVAAQLSAAQAQLESLRRQLRISNETITPENVDARIRHLVEAAQADASQLRMETEARADEVRAAMSEQSTRTIAQAEADAGTLRADAQAHADRLRTDTEAEVVGIKAAAEASAARLIATAQTQAEAMLASAAVKCAEADEYHSRQVADADAHRAWVESDVAWLNATAAEERERLDLEAEAERARLEDARMQAEEESVAERARLDALHAATRERLDVDAETARQVAQDDFEIVLRSRRTVEKESSDQMLAEADATAARIVHHAEDHAAELVFNAEAEVRRLHSERDAAHDTLREVHQKLAGAIAVAMTPTPHAS